MNASERKVVLVTRRTRLEELVARFNTMTQARFYVEHLGADFSDYEREHEVYHAQRHTTLRCRSMQVSSTSPPSRFHQFSLEKISTSL